ncbi:MAG: ATP-dependent helicase HepA [Candidatus Sumerlaeota bacterium]|nr:ATP-dependent helicase HepA [Candidatus Sumerlaeota bacterium]
MTPSASNANTAAVPAYKIGMLVTLREAIAPDMWRIVDLEGRIATLAPISLGATRHQVPVTDLRRYQIKTTDQVFRKQELITIKRLCNPRATELYEYEGVGEDGTLLTVREHELEVLHGSEAPSPLSQLQSLDASPAGLARARAELLHAYFDATVRSLGIVGYNGARMLPIPHQISAARYALLFGRTRFLLADEVGLGKTVEAGLIVSTLRKYFPSWQTAFFVPESLTVQWALEMYGKFGKSIFRLNEDEEPEEGEEDPGVILSHARAIKWAGKRRTPEIIVVDEAHQVLRDPATYDALLKLSRKAHAVMLLTATPSSDDGSNLLKLLHLVDPDFYAGITSESQLAALLDKAECVETLLKALRDPSVGGEAIRDLWEKVGTEDNELTARILSLIVDPSDALVRHKLAALVTDRYYPRARILRYQRKFLATDNEMAERVEEPIEYEPGRQETKVQGLVRQWLDLVKANNLADRPGWQDTAAILIQAAHSTPLAVEQWLEARLGKMEPYEGVTADPVRRNRELIESLERLPGEDELLEQLQKATVIWTRQSKAADMKGRALAQLPRYLAMRARLLEMLEDKDDPHRLIVFTSFDCNVRPLYLLLNKALGEDVEVFSISADVEWREREKSAFAFQECRGRCVLISDELGGEGRNFQFANALFHFDVPPASWIVEQRIGRLDRVGRDPHLDVDSQVLVAKEQLDAAIYDFQRDGVSVFNESLAPVEDRVENVTRRLVCACIMGGPDAVRDLIDETHEELEERREREARGLQTRSDTGVEDVKKLVPRLRDNEELQTLGDRVVAFTRMLGSVVDRSHDRVTLTVGSHHPLHAFTGVLSEMEGFFNRIQAVRHERLEFFSPGHPFVRAMARIALQDSQDRVAFIERSGIPRGAFVFSCRIAIPPSFLEAIRELPEDIQPALFCSAAGNFPTRMTHVIVDFDGKPIEDEEERALYLAPYQKSEPSLDTGPAILDYLPKDWDGVVTRAGEFALEAARLDAKAHLTKTMGPFQALLSEVLTRHFGSEFAVEAQIDTILFHLDPLAVDIDSVAAFFPGK